MKGVGFWLGVVMLLLVAPLKAQQQQEAMCLLDRTAEAFSKAGGIRMTFMVSAPEGTSKGVVTLKGEKFVLEAAGMKTWFDGHTQWTYIEDMHEVNVSEPSAAELQSLSPYAWLSLYRQGYRLKLEETGQTRICRVVMTATRADQEIRSLTVTVDRESLRLQKVSFVPAGSRQATTVVADRYEAGLDLADAAFAFNARQYPGVEVIDLR